MNSIGFGTIKNQNFVNASDWLLMSGQWKKKEEKEKNLFEEFCKFLFSSRKKDMFSWIRRKQKELIQEILKIFPSSRRKKRRILF